MKFTVHSRLLLLIAILGTTLSAQDLPSGIEAENRIWTSTAGSQFEGRLKEANPKEVVLVNAAGREVKVPLSGLSPADLVYLGELERQRHVAALQSYNSEEFDVSDLPPRAEVEGVRHVRQRENFCVPASAEMLVRYFGYDYDQDYLAEISSRDSSRSAGTNFTDLARAMRNLGIDSVGIPWGAPGRDVPRRVNLLNGIRTAIADGRPVLISYDTLGSGHAVVAVGYDDRRRSFSVMDPAQGKKPQPLLYEVLEELITGAMVVIPAPQTAANGLLPEDSAAQTAFLSTVSNLLLSIEPAALHNLPERLAAENIPARFRDANRRDLRSSQGQTRSFARRDGVGFVELALERGLVVAAPQAFDEGPGLILIYGMADNVFQAVEYRPDGTALKAGVRPLDFSLRWLWRDQGQFFLPLVEIGS